MAGDARFRIETDLGAIDIAVHVDRAPTTAAYVRQLVKNGAFTDTLFYRSSTLGVPDRRPLIQGGSLALLVLGSDTANRKVAMLESIETTEDTGLRHQNGTVSLARDLDRTGHVLPELFICLDHYPELDAGGRSEPDERGFPDERVQRHSQLDPDGRQKRMRRERSQSCRWVFALAVVGVEHPLAKRGRFHEIGAKDRGEKAAADGNAWFASACSSNFSRRASSIRWNGSRAGQTAETAGDVLVLEGWLVGSYWAPMS